ncbi:MAG: hypothetical protein CJBNEKGG_03886 [Prosthecobacter sp.]|nr:hypothetical protein [Prosthecobacter sp.]
MFVGIKAHTAERHWRHLARVDGFPLGNEVASKPTQPKGIGDRNLGHEVLELIRPASKPTQPKGIGDRSASR